MERLSACENFLRHSFRNVSLSLHPRRKAKFISQFPPNVISADFKEMSKSMAFAGNFILSFVGAFAMGWFACELLIIDDLAAKATLGVAFLGHGVRYITSGGGD